MKYRPDSTISLFDERQSILPFHRFSSVFAEVRSFHHVTDGPDCTSSRSPSDSSQAIASRLRTSLPSPSTPLRPIARARHYRFLRGKVNEVRRNNACASVRLTGRGNIMVINSRLSAELLFSHGHHDSSEWRVDFYAKNLCCALRMCYLFAKINDRFVKV